MSILTPNTIVKVLNPTSDVDLYEIDCAYDQTVNIYVAYETGVEEDGNSTCLIRPTGKTEEGYPTAHIVS